MHISYMCTYKCRYLPIRPSQMTGRKGRVVSMDDGTIKYETRSEQDAPLEILNLTEKQRFMDGEKVSLVIRSLMVY